MDTNLDQKQLLILGYLRNLLNDASLFDYQLGNNTNHNSKNDLSSLSKLICSQNDNSNSSKYHDNMEIFNLSQPPTERTTRAMSIASDLSDINISLNSLSFKYQLPLSIIQFVYLYFNRHQQYLLLLGGSEECKDSSYNQIQIINLRNISDIKQKIDYPYSNYRLKPYLWRENINYNKYFRKSNTKYMLKSSVTVATPEPISSDIGDIPHVNNAYTSAAAGTGYKPMIPPNISTTTKKKKKKKKSITMKISSPVKDQSYASWSAMNSPYSPINATKNYNLASPFAVVDDKKDNKTKTKTKSKAKNKIYSSTPKIKARITKSKSHANIHMTRKQAMELMKLQKKHHGGSASVKAKKKSDTFQKRMSKSNKSSNNVINKKPNKKKSSKKIKKSVKQKDKTKERKARMKRSQSTSKVPAMGNFGSGSKSGSGSGKAGIQIRSVMNGVDWDKYSYGECIMNISNSKIGILPSWPWLNNKYTKDIKRKTDNLEFAKYKMYIRSGGIISKSDDYTNENDLILFNAANLNDCGRQIDAYYCKLPSFKQSIEGPTVIYNEINTLLSFGGYSYDDGRALKTIYSLNLNTLRNKFKWKKYGCLMNRPRYKSSVCRTVSVTGQQKFVIIGGKGTNSKPLVDVEIFDSSKTKKSSKCTILSELNYARTGCSSTKLYHREQIIVGGGMLYGKGCDQLEILDLIKNKFILHPAKFVYEHQHPTIWSEVREINPNIIYCAGNNISFGAKKQSLGYVEWIDLRSKKKKFNLLYPEPLDQLFEFWGLRPNLWEPRSLLHFAL